MIYQWKWPEPVSVANDVTLSQYDYLNITLANHTEIKVRGKCTKFKTNVIARVTLLHNL